MALRDPGAPRRNPLFAVDEPAAAGPESRRRGADDGWDDWADDPIFGGVRQPVVRCARAARSARSSPR